VENQFRTPDIHEPQQTKKVDDEYSKKINTEAVSAEKVIFALMKVLNT